MQADTTTTTMDDAGRASLGPTIMGAVIGAAVGIAVHLVIETGGFNHWQPKEASWFAIIIGLLTGVGVRQMNKHHMERSYLRGAVSGIIALAAIVLSTVLISKVMEHYDALSKNKPVAAKGEDAADATADNNAAAEASKTEPAAAPAAAGPAGPAVGGVGRIRQDKLNPWQFVFMAVGALAAYELGRGVDHSRRTEIVGAGEPMPVATDPSN